MKIIVTESNGTVTATCLVPRPGGGEIEVMEQVSSKPIEEELTALTAMEAGLPVTETGRRFGRRIKRAARKVAHSKVISKIRKGAEMVMRSPIGDIAKATPQGQAAMRGYRMAKKVTNTADALARRDRRAQRAVHQLRRYAASGHQPSAVIVGEIRRCFANRYGYNASGPLVITHTGSHIRNHPHYDQRTGMCGRGYHRHELGPVTVSGVQDAAKWLWGELRPQVGRAGSELWGGNYGQGLSAAIQMAGPKRQARRHILRVTDPGVDPEAGLR